MDIDQADFVFAVLFILGCAAQARPLLRPGGRATTFAAAGMVLVLSCAIRDRDWTLLTGQVIVSMLLWSWSKKP